MKDLQFDYNSPINFTYPAGNASRISTAQEIFFICLNHCLEGRKVTPYFKINNLELNHHYYSPRIIKTREVVLWTHLYIHVLAPSGVTDYNGDTTIITEDGTFKSISLEQLLWFEYFTSSMVTNS